MPRPESFGVNTPDAARLLIKVCCISSIEDAELAINGGADLLGLVSAMPSGPGVISDDEITQIRERVKGRAKTVLLTSRITAEAIGRQLRSHQPDVVQLCDALAIPEILALRSNWPDVTLMQVIHVRNAASVDEAASTAEHVDALLLDSGNPAAAIKELGGTGRVHDWQLSRAIRDSVNVPVFLAGGLRAENVADAVTTVRPSGVDVCSGVRTEGKLDRQRLKAFMASARRS
jgi:phosphoribosylanthranilate isomerase